jgi:hypothetical protein
MRDPNQKMTALATRFATTFDLIEKPGRLLSISHPADTIP